MKKDMNFARHELELKFATGPIFVVGMNGSGTSMLADCLDNSPYVYVFPWETRIIPWFVVNLERFGDLRSESNLKRLFNAFANSAEFLRPSVRLDARIENVREPSLYGVVDCVYRTIAVDKKGVERWLEKSPMNVYFMTDIARHIPSARFIHIYRDGRDVAISNRRRFFWDLESTISKWVSAVRRGREDGRALGSSKYFEIRYEDFTGFPEESMRRICDFLDIQYDPSLLKSGMPWLNGPGRNALNFKTGRIVSNSGKWHTQLTSAEQFLLERIGGKLLSELGYPTEQPESELSPTWLQTKIWLLKDYGARLRYQIQHRSFSKNPMRKLKSYVERIRYRNNQR